MLQVLGARRGSTRAALSSRPRGVEAVPWAIALVAVVPVLLAAIEGIRAGWWPVGDEALTALSAWDVLHGHAPVMGPRTTTAFETGIETHHPGPVLYYLLALPLSVSSGQPWGLILGSVLVVGALVLVAVRAAHRVGGLIPAACVGAAFLCLQWALGPDAGARPFNPYPPAFAVITWLVLTWALLSEHLRYVPHYVVVTSLMVQSHIGYLPFVASPVVVLVGVGMWRWWARRHAVWPAQGWRPQDAGRHRRAVLVAAVLAVLMWLPPLVELVRFSPNNLEQVLTYIAAPRGEPVDPAVAARFALGLLAPVGGGIDDAGNVADLASAHPVRHPRSTMATGLGCVVVLLVVTLAVIGSERVRSRAPRAARRWMPTRSEQRAALAAGLGLMATAVTVGSLPLSATETTWNYLQTWSVVFFVWAVLVWVVLRRLVMAARPTLRPRLVGATCALVLVAAAAAAIASPAPSRWEEGRSVVAAMPAVRDLLQQTRTEAGGGRLHVTFDADTLGAGYYIAPSMGYDLHEDYAIHLPAVWKSPEDTDFRKAVSSPPDTAWISIRAGVRGGGADVDSRSQVVAQVVDRRGDAYTIFYRGPDRTAP